MPPEIYTRLGDVSQLLQPAALHHHTEADESILAEGLAEGLGGLAIASAEQVQNTLQAFCKPCMLAHASHRSRITVAVHTKRPRSDTCQHMVGLRCASAQTNTHPSRGLTAVSADNSRLVCSVISEWSPFTGVSCPADKVCRACRAGVFDACVPACACTALAMPCMCYLKQPLPRACALHESFCTWQETWLLLMGLAALRTALRCAERLALIPALCGCS